MEVENSNVHYQTHFADYNMSMMTDAEKLKRYDARDHEKGYECG